MERESKKNEIEREFCFASNILIRLVGIFSLSLSSQDRKVPLDRRTNAREIIAFLISSFSISWGEKSFEGKSQKNMIKSNNKVEKS